jgi:hypothetical protein
MVEDDDVRARPLELLDESVAVLRGGDEREAVGPLDEPSQSGQDGGMVVEGGDADHAVEDGAARPRRAWSRASTRSRSRRRRYGWTSPRRMA